MKKYERPSGEYAGSLELANRSKYQADASAQPKVAISSQKMDGDFNYILDALNEIDEASGSRASIAERLSVLLNADGSLKASVVTAMDDWINDDALSGFTRVDNSTVTFNGGTEALYLKNRRVRLIVNGAPLFASVSQTQNSAGVTTLELVDIVNANGDVAVIDAAPTSVAYSPISPSLTGNAPLGFDKLNLQNFALTVNGSNLEILENTGSVSVPNWVLRARVTSSGFELADGCVTNSKIGANAVTFNKLSTTIIASKGEAEAGSSTTKLMTPKRVGEQITQHLIDNPVGGKVLQVVTSYDDTSGQIITTSETFQDAPGLSATITPTSVTSKILVMMEFGSLTAGGTNVRMLTKLFRNGVQVTRNMMHRFSASMSVYTHRHMSHVDSPNSTSPVTYKLQFAADPFGNNTGFVTAQSSSSEGMPRKVYLIEIEG